MEGRSPRGATTSGKERRGGDVQATHHYKERKGKNNGKK